MMESYELKMPALFLGHGSPMNVIEENQFSKGWELLGKRIPKPKAIVSVSAHWETQGTHVTAMSHPNTIHDFGNFPQALFDIQYPAHGDPALAARIKSLVRTTEVHLTQEWGLDHGTWCLLTKMYPDADIPVLQLSLDKELKPMDHFAIGRELKPLRDDGILILGSGNIVHNLSQVSSDPETGPAAWAIEFDETIKQLLLKGQYQNMIDYESLGETARLSVPTAEHYLPLLYIIALQNEGERVTFPVEGIVAKSISMRSVMIS